MNSFFRRLVAEIAQNNKTTFPYALGISLISNIQTIWMVLRPVFNYQESNKGPIVKLTATILENIEEIGSVKPNNQPYILFIVMAYMILHFILFILLVVLNIYDKDTIRNKLLRILAIIYLLHSRVLCSVISYLLTQMITFQNNCDRLINDSFECTRAWLVLASLTSASNIGLALAQEFFLYRITKNKDAYAVKNNSFHQVILFQKILAIFLYSLITDTDLRAQLNSIFNFILSFLALGVLYLKLPFFDTRILKESIITTTIAFTTSLISILRVLGVPQDGLEVIWIFLCLLGVKISLASLNNLLYEILQGSSESPERAIHFVVLLRQNKFGSIPHFFFEEKLSLKTVTINGTLSHSVNGNGSIKDSKTKSEYERNVYLYSMLYLEKVRARNPNSEVLLLFMAQMYFKKLKNIPKVMDIVRTLQTLSLPVWASNSMLDFENKLRRLYTKQYLLNSTQDTLDVVSYFRCRGDAIYVKENILKEVGKHLEFWEELKKDEVDVRAISLIAQRIEYFSDIISKKQQENASYLGNHFANLLVIFGIYSDTVQENLQEARKYISNFMSINHSLLGQPLDIYSDKEAVVIIPVEKDGLGKIIDASGSAQGFFQMPKEQILNKPLNILLPSIVTNHLFKMVDSFLDLVTGNSSYKLISYAKTLNGSIFEVEIEVRLYPEIYNGAKLTVFFKKVSSPKLYIIIDSRGNIIECSEKLQKRFNFPRTQSRRVKIQEILSEYDRINTLYKIADSKVLDNDEDKPVSARRFKSLKTINLFTSEATRRNLVTTEEVTKVQSPHEAKAIMSTKTMSPDPNEQSSFNDIPNTNRVFSVNQTERKMSQIDKKLHLFRFVPFNNSSEEKTQLPFNVDIKLHVIGSETYKVLTLMRPPDRVKFEVLSKQSVTLNDHFSMKFETRTFDDDDERVAVRRVSKFRTTKFEEFNSQRYVRTQTIRENKSQKAASPVKKNPYNYNVRRFSVKEKQTERDSSLTGSSSGTMMSVKALRNLLNGKSAYYSLKRINFVIWMIIVFTACLGGVNLFFSQKSLDEIDVGVHIVNYATMRLSESMRGWQLCGRLYVRYLKLRDGSINSLRTLIYEKGLAMLDYDKKLSQKISSLSQSSLMKELYTKDIELWEIYQNKRFNNERTDSFVASKLLGEKMVFVGNSSSDYDSPIVLDEIVYLINNTGNDYLTSSENLLTVTQNMLGRIIQDNITTLQFMLGAESTAVVVLCLSLIIAGKKIFDSYRILFRALVKIDYQQIENRVRGLQRLKEILTDDIETRQFGLDALDIMDASPEINVKLQKEGRLREREAKLNFNSFTVYLVKVIGISLFIIQIITVFFIASLSISISDFESLQRVSNQLYMTSLSGYGVTMVASIFYVDMMFRNDTSFQVRKEAPSAQLIRSLYLFKQANYYILSAYDEGETGISDPFVKEILQERVCKYLPDNIQAYCAAASQTGSKEIGILDLNSKLLLIMEYYSNLYFNNPTIANVKSFIDNYVGKMRPTVDTLEEAYFALNSHIVESFEQQKGDFILRTTYMYIGILASLAVSLLAIQFVSLRRLKLLDLARGQILKTVSYKILLENKAMKFYLSKYFITKIN